MRSVQAMERGAGELVDVVPGLWPDRSKEGATGQPAGETSSVDSALAKEKPAASAGSMDLAGSLGNWPDGEEGARSEKKIEGGVEKRLGMPKLDLGV